MFIATKDSLITSGEPDLDADGEIVWASIQFSNSKPLFLASFDRPPGNKIQSVDALDSSLSKIINRNPRQHPNVIFIGDFNLPDINWTTWQPTSSKSKSHYMRHF